MGHLLHNCSHKVTVDLMSEILVPVRILSLISTEHSDLGFKAGKVSNLYVIQCGEFLIWDNAFEILEHFHILFSISECFSSAWECKQPVTSEESTSPHMREKKCPYMLTM